MSTFRYIWNAASLGVINATVDPNATIGSDSAAFFVDIILSNDAQKPDLDIEMANLGFSFYVASPTMPPQSGLYSPSGAIWSLEVGNNGLLSLVSPSGVTGAIGSTGP